MSHPTWERPIWGPSFKGIFGGISKATNLADFCLWSHGLFRVERQFRQKTSRMNTQVKEDRAEQ